MIEIGDYRMHKCDDYNWCVEQKRIGKEGKVKGLELWGNRKYYPKLEQAAMSLFDKLVSGAEANSVNELITTIFKVKEDIIEAVGGR